MLYSPFNTCWVRDGIAREVITERDAGGRDVTRHGHGAIRAKQIAAADENF
jgi:Xaa-Pro aminopeptidase